MSLVLELSPFEERQITSFAKEAGLPTIDYAHRLLVGALRDQTRGSRRTEAARQAWQERRTEIAQSFAASSITEEELEAHAQQMTKESRAARSARDTETR